MTYDPHTRKPTGFQLLPDRGHKLVTNGELTEVDTPVLIPYHAVDSVTNLLEEELEEIGIRSGFLDRWCVLVTASGLRYLIKQRAERFVDVWDSV